MSEYIELNSDTYYDLSNEISFEVKDLLERKEQMEFWYNDEAREILVAEEEIDRLKKLINEKRNNIKLAKKEVKVMQREINCNTKFLTALNKKIKSNGSHVVDKEKKKVR